MRLVLFLAIAAAALPAAVWPAGLTATGAGIAERDGAVEATVVFSGPAAFDPPPRVFVLAAPPRIVLDLPLVDWRIPSPPEGAGVARGLRYGLAAPGRSRLVVDLERPAAVTGLRVAPTPDGGARLSIVIRPVDGARFAAAAGWPDGPPVASRPRADALVVAVDAGHGGADPGAAWAGVLEKDVTLSFARALAEALVRHGAQPLMIRETDVLVSLAARTAAARAAGADAIVSLHADSGPNGWGGASVYVLSDAATDDLAARLAEGADASDSAALAGLPGVESDVAAAIAEMALPQTEAASERLGAALVSAMSAVGPVLETNPLRRAGFRVLRAPDVPAALIELGFLSNAEDRARLTDPEWRRAAADGIAQALTAWRAQEIAAPPAAP